MQYYIQIFLRFNIFLTFQPKKGMCGGDIDTVIPSRETAMNPNNHYYLIAKFAENR